MVNVRLRWSEEEVERIDKLLIVELFENVNEVIRGQPITPFEMTCIEQFVKKSLDIISFTIYKVGELIEWKRYKYSKVV
jgi:translation elongation factor EF-Ts